MNDPYASVRNLRDDTNLTLDSGSAIEDDEVMVQIREPIPPLETTPSAPVATSSPMRRQSPANQTTRLTRRQSPSPDRNHQRQPNSNTIFVADASFTPKQFTGAETKQDVDNWLQYFNNYVEYRQLTNVDKARLFKLLLTEKAAAWLTSQKLDANEFETIIQAFKIRFTRSEIHKWQMADHVWSRVQAPGESVDDFATDIINNARIIPITDENLVKFSIIEGLRNEIKLHVLNSSTKTLDAVLTSARTAEAAVKAAGQTENSKIEKLTAQLEALVKQINTNPVNIVDGPPARTKSPTRPTVHFEQPSDYESREARSRQQPDWSMNRNRPSSWERRPIRQTEMDRPPQRQSQNAEYQPQPQETRTSWEQPTQGRTNWTPPPRTPPSQRQQGLNTQQYTQYELRSNACVRCGISHGLNNCRALNDRCFKCGNFGHFSRCCAAQNSSYNPGNRQY